MMEQTNSAEGPFINNVGLFLNHFYQPTSLLCPFILYESCQKTIRQLSQICQAFISKVIRQLSNSYHKVVRPFSLKSKQLSGCHQAVVFEGSCREVVKKFSRSLQTDKLSDNYHKVVRPSS